MKLPWLDGRMKWGTATVLAALWLTLSGTASAGIADTKHNLGNTSTQTNHVTGTGNSDTTTNEICVFCHTPHGADVTTPNAPPLWNKRLNTGATYTTYATLNTPSLDGEVLPVGSISVACLSCHDGTQAMDNIINAPGSGAYQADGGGAEGRNYTWTAAGPGGRMAPGIANLGENLSNDHPIGIQYCGGGISGAGNATSGTCKDGDFVSSAARLKTAAGAGGQQFWIETGAVADGVKTRTDLPLYTRTFAGGVGPSVECGSCHDPHVSEGQAGPNGQTAGATFLRISNSASAVCTSCHVK
ncbi:MAG: hypothetical protein JNK55_04735 [Rubrivivax sp.]|nr:hypothetical protein [Rubrivivax sp.]